MRKAFLKRTADILEKMAIASAAVGVFQGQNIGIWVGMASIVLCYIFTYWEAKK